MSSMGPGVCDLMVSQDIMTSVVILVKRYYSDWAPQVGKISAAEKAEKGKIDSVTETFVQALNLLWNLCENNTNAVRIFSKEGLINTVSKCLNTEVFGTRVGIAAAQVLNMITEGNKGIIQNLAEFNALLENILSSPQVQAEVNEQGSTDWAYLQILATGILLNLHDGELSKLSPPNVSLVLMKLSSTLEMNGIEAMKSFSSLVPISVGNGDSMDTDHSTNILKKIIVNGEDLDLEKIRELETKSQNIITSLSAQILSLELLSNLIFVDEDEDGSEVGEDDSGDSAMEDFDDSGMEVDVGNGDDGPAETGYITEVCQQIKNHALVPKVINKTQDVPANVSDILLNNSDYGRPIMIKLRQLRCTALLCFQNIVVGLKVADLGGTEAVRTIWDSISRSLAAHQGVSEDKDTNDVLEASTSALRALVQRAVEEDSGDFVNLESLQLFSNLLPTVSTEKICANLIKTFGGLGILLTRNKIGGRALDGDVILLRIGQMLLDSVTAGGSGRPATSLWCVSEALDTLFDVFAEDDHNHVMKELAVIEKLKSFLPKFKNWIRSERRNLGENRAVIETTRTNLARFIDYKVKHGDCV